MRDSAVTAHRPRCSGPAGGEGQQMKILKRRWWLAAAAAVLVAVSAVLTTVGSGGANAAPSTAASARAGGLGQLAGLLPRNHLTEESALQVDLSKETVRLPLYPGTANGKTVWYVLLDASDAGLAHDLGVNYAPKLANLAIGCPECVQSVTLSHQRRSRIGSGKLRSTSRGRRDR